MRVGINLLNLTHPFYALILKGFALEFLQLHANVLGFCCKENKCNLVYMRRLNNHLHNKFMKIIFYRNLSFVNIFLNNKFLYSHWVFFTFRRMMDTTTFYEVMVTEYEKAKQFLSESSGELSYIFVILSLTLVFTIATLREFAIWKMQMDSLKTTSNSMIFFGQLFLTVGILCTIKSIESFHIHILHSFMLCTVACYFLSGSAILSYDLKRPPSQTLGVSMCILAVSCLIACVYCQYNKLLLEFVGASSILSFNVFVYGIAFLSLNVLEEVYRRLQFVHWRDFFQGTNTN